ncbi:MAG TPA: class I SAM-dependent methyltransferase [Desulfobulbaceae bacterium]|nr:class I SAM-dependent methyltransferase [Desulfobulbaceae bacterium]
MEKKYKVKEIKSGWQDSNVANTYDAKRFSSISGRLSDWLDKRAIKKTTASLPKTVKILDMPCGTGRISHCLLSLGYNRVTCADISEDMIKVATSLLKPFPHVAFYKIDAEKTPFENASFNAIVSIRFMGHVPKDVRIKILKEMGRICSGRIIVEYPVTNPFARFVKKVFKKFTVEKKLPSQWTWHYLSMAEAKQEVAEAGLVTKKIVRKLSYISESAYFSISNVS